MTTARKRRSWEFSYTVTIKNQIEAKHMVAIKKQIEAKPIQ